MFIGIFGIETKTKTQGEVTALNCPEHGMIRGAIEMTFTYFHFFFIPLFRWNREYRLVLRCGCVYVMTREQAEAAIDGGKVDLEQMVRVHSGYQPEYKHCGACGKNFDSSYRYCPFCGTELKR